MAPNLKKIALLGDDSFADASAFLAVVKGNAQPREEESPRCEEGQARDGSSLSYWDWPAPTPSAPTSDHPVSLPAVDLFSANHLQSNLIQASVLAARNQPTGAVVVTAAAASTGASNDEDEHYYWAERDQHDEMDEAADAAEEIQAGAKVPQHHPLSLSVSSDAYWRDARGKLSESDSYWTHTSDIDNVTFTKVVKDNESLCQKKVAAAVSDNYWDESRHRLSKSDVYWNFAASGAAADASEYFAVVARRGSSLLGRSECSSSLESPWLWSHERTESDMYWNWESSPPVVAAARSPPAVLTC